MDPLEQLNMDPLERLKKLYGSLRPGSDAAKRAEKLISDHRASGGSPQGILPDLQRLVDGQQTVIGGHEGALSRTAGAIAQFGNSSLAAGEGGLKLLSKVAGGPRTKVGNALERGSNWFAGKRDMLEAADPSGGVAGKVAEGMKLAGTAANYSLAGAGGGAALGRMGAAGRAIAGAGEGAEGLKGALLRQLGATAKVAPLLAAHSQTDQGGFASHAMGLKGGAATASDLAEDVVAGTGLSALAGKIGARSAAKKLAAEEADAVAEASAKAAAEKKAATAAKRAATKTAKAQATAAPVVAEAEAAVKPAKTRAKRLPKADAAVAEDLPAATASSPTVKMIDDYTDDELRSAAKTALKSKDPKVMQGVVAEMKVRNEAARQQGIPPAFKLGDDAVEEVVTKPAKAPAPVEAAAPAETATPAPKRDKEMKAKKAAELEDIAKTAAQEGDADRSARALAELKVRSEAKTVRTGKSPVVVKGKTIGGKTLTEADLAEGHQLEAQMVTDAEERGKVQSVPETLLKGWSDQELDKNIGIMTRKASASGDPLAHEQAIRYKEEKATRNHDQPEITSDVQREASRVSRTNRLTDMEPLRPHIEALTEAHGGIDGLPTKEVQLVKQGEPVLDKNGKPVLVTQISQEKGRSFGSTSEEVAKDARTAFEKQDYEEAAAQVREMQRRDANRVARGKAPTFFESADKGAKPKATDLDPEDVKRSVAKSQPSTEQTIAPLTDEEIAAKTAEAKVRDAAVEARASGTAAPTTKGKTLPKIESSETDVEALKAGRKRMISEVKDHLDTLPLAEVRARAAKLEGQLEKMIQAGDADGERAVGSELAHLSHVIDNRTERMAGLDLSMNDHDLKDVHAELTQDVKTHHQSGNLARKNKAHANLRNVQMEVEARANGWKTQHEQLGTEASASKAKKAARDLALQGNQTANRALTKQLKSHPFNTLLHFFFSGGLSKEKEAAVMGEVWRRAHAGDPEATTFLVENFGAKHVQNELRNYSPSGPVKPSRVSSEPLELHDKQLPASTPDKIVNPELAPHTEAEAAPLGTVEKNLRAQIIEAVNAGDYDRAAEIGAKLREQGTALGGKLVRLGKDSEEAAIKEEARQAGAAKRRIAGKKVTELSEPEKLLATERAKRRGVNPFSAMDIPNLHNELEMASADRDRIAQTDDPLALARVKQRIADIMEVLDKRKNHEIGPDSFSAGEGASASPLAEAPHATPTEERFSSSDRDALLAQRKAELLAERAAKAEKVDGVALTREQVMADEKTKRNARLDAKAKAEGRDVTPPPTEVPAEVVAPTAKASTSRVVAEAPTSGQGDTEQLGRRAVAKAADHVHITTEFKGQPEGTTHLLDDGHGSPEVLRDITEAADAHGMRLTAEVQPGDPSFTHYLAAGFKQRFAGYGFLVRPAAKQEIRRAVTGAVVGGAVASPAALKADDGSEDTSAGDRASTIGLAMLGGAAAAVGGGRLLHRAKLAKNVGHDVREEASRLIEAAKAKGAKLSTTDQLAPLKKMNKLRNAPMVALSAMDTPLKVLNGRSPSQLINLDREGFNGLSPHAQSRFVGRLVEQNKGVIPPVETWKDVQKAANRWMRTMGPDQILALGPKDARRAATTAIAGTLLESIHEVEGMEKELAALKGVKGKAMRRQQLLASIEASEADQMHMARFVKAAGGEQARDLNAMKQIALMQSPAMFTARMERMLNKAGHYLSPEETKTIQQLMRSGKHEEAINYVVGLQQPSLLQMVVGIRNTGLLAGIPGRIRDITSSVTNLGLEKTIHATISQATDRVAGTQVAKALRASGRVVPGIPRSVAMPDVAMLGETAGGVGKGLKHFANTTMGLEAVRAAPSGQKWEAWKSAMQTLSLTPEQLARQDLPPNRDIKHFTGVDAVDKTLNLYHHVVQNVTAGVDDITKFGAHSAEMRNQAKLAAMDDVRHGLVPKGELASRTTHYMEHPNEDMLHAVKMFGVRTTFQNREQAAAAATLVKTELPRIVHDYSMKHGMGPGMGRAVKAMVDFVIPFATTGSNIGARVMDYTPFGLLRGAMMLHGLTNEIRAGRVVNDALIRATQRDAVDAFSRGTAGSAIGLLTAGATAYRKGILSGMSPDTQEARDANKAVGRTTNSINILNHWVPIGTYSPIGNILSMGATLAEQASKEGVGEEGLKGWLMLAAKQALDVVSTSSRATLDQPLFTGVKQGMDFVQGKPGAASNYLSQAASSFVPTFVSDIAGATDDSKSRLLDRSNPVALAGTSIARRIPGLRQMLPQEYDVTGKEVKGREGGLLNVISPFQGTTASENTPVGRLLLASGGISPPRRENGETLEDYSHRLKVTGEFVNAELSKLVKDQMVPFPETQADRDALSDLVHQAASRGRARAAAMIPAARQSRIAERRGRQQAARHMRDMIGGDGS